MAYPSSMPFRAYLEVEVYRNQKIYYQRYEKGESKTPLEIRGETARTGTKIRFTPDPEIFEITIFDFETLAKRMRELSFSDQRVAHQNFG